MEAKPKILDWIKAIDKCDERKWGVRTPCLEHTVHKIMHISICWWYEPESLTDNHIIILFFVLNILYNKSIIKAEYTIVP